MGACNSTKENTIKDKSVEKDFEHFRQISKKGNIYEIKAKLWQMNNVNGKIKHKLLNKYFFLKPNGEFESKIKTPSSGKEVIIEGVLEKSKKIKFTYKEVFPGKEGENLINFEGEVKIFNNRLFSTLQLQIIKNEFDTDFSGMYQLNFPKVAWKVENSFGPNTKSFNLFMDFDDEEKSFKGISWDDRGFALWAGLGKEMPKANIVQCYIGNNSEEEENIFSYVGVYDRILGFTIEGTVTNSKFATPGSFTIKRISNSTNK